MEPDRKVREPMVVAFARVRLAWAELWVTVGMELVKSYQRKMITEARYIREWERESQPN